MVCCFYNFRIIKNYFLCSFLCLSVFQLCRAVQYNTTATNIKWVFIFKLVKIEFNYKLSASVALAIFQVLSSHI